ncbi:MAG TPA: VOC family protein [Chthonomonadaceae bacterium]|nr:VOC family protein [Chthonomonadaceae bacterium]
MGQPVVHFEIGCQDKARAARFYSDLFGWQTQPAGPATLIDTGNANGINGHFTALGHEPSRYVLVYIQVDDLAPYLERAETLGGGIVVPPVQLPDGRRFAWLSDPEGNTLGLITPPPG